MIEVGISGSSTMDEEIGLDDEVIVVVLGRCVAEGKKATAHKGHVETRTVKIDELIVLTGPEAKDFESRVRAEAHQRDAERVKSVIDIELFDGDELTA